MPHKDERDGWIDGLNEWKSYLSHLFHSSNLVFSEEEYGYTGGTAI